MPACWRCHPRRPLWVSLPDNAHDHFSLLLLRQFPLADLKPPRSPGEMETFPQVRIAAGRIGIAELDSTGRADLL
jgi:hypothetical protein